MNYLIHNLMGITRETWGWIVAWTLLVGGMTALRVHRTGWTRSLLIPLAFLALFGAFVAGIVNPIFLSAHAAARRYPPR